MCKKLTCGIYEIKNNETNKVYIGQSVNIEKRWQSHLNLNPINTSQNLMPTLKLAKQSPEMVELNIIHTIIQEGFEDYDIKFILSVYERYELNRKGGHTADNTINVRPVTLPMCSPKILKYPNIKNFVDESEILKSIAEWFEQKEYASFISKENTYSIDDITVASYEDKINTLQKRINELLDEQLSLENMITFWKGRCGYWRDLNGM